ncbi:hypothetical protein [Aquisalinus flavus]|uniref:Uncharacterized protein n=1 Tax=Aquisalinus flavus TaxID=1526572 RepID=A0A8J2V6S5_9PROT|nr:hypothetical protein [Aquisalinus flavus]MBD0425227.1 hypothetical protein [Aquisalinus flavus]UNE49112.1 hypothetical protein FF099_14160 [Aquisalinus flavus]GGD17719.1 hypothetical protein GCM10011342_28180 [Aquisalinus flavus]
MATHSRRFSGKKAGLKATTAAGAAGFVIAAAVFGVLSSAAKAAQADAIEPMDKASVTMDEEASLAWAMPAAEADPHLLGPDARRYAAWAALAGLISSAVALIGANRLLNWLAGAGTALGKAGAAAAKAPVKAARAAAKATSKILKKPGRWLITVVSLTVFALTGVAFLDIQWEAGMLAGAGLSAAAIWGWTKSGDAIGRALAPLRGMGAKQAEPDDLAAAV